MTWTVELANDPQLSGWTALTTIDRATLRVGGVANQTEVGTGSGFDLDDDAGSIAIPGRRPIRFIETAPGYAAELFHGRVSTKQLRRGTRHDGSAKQFDVGLDDYNQDLRGIIVDGWVRPAETDYARVIALHAAFLNGSASTSSRKRTSTALLTNYVLNANLRTLPAETFNNTDPATVLRDCADQAGKDCFVTVDGQIFYAVPTSAAFTSSLSITDTDPNFTTSFPPIWAGDAATEDPTELLSGLKVKYGAGENTSVSESRSAVEAAFDKWETTVFLDTASQTKAEGYLDTILDAQGIEEKVRRCSVVIPAALIDLIQWGHRISFRAAATGDLSAVFLRIGYLMLEPPGAEDGPYLVHLELSKPKKLAPRVRKGTDPAAGSGTGAPFEDCCPPFDGIGTPDPGQPVLNEFVATGDGATTAWTTDFPYSTGSLRVWVDGLNVTGAATETTPATGAFSLSFAPATGEVVRVSYNGAL